MSKIIHYIRDWFAHETEALHIARHSPLLNGLPSMSIRPEEGKMLQVLARAVGAEKIIEIGTLTGYSGIWLAGALPAGGMLHTIERDPQHIAVAQANFAQAGLSDRVTIHQGEAEELLGQLSDIGPFDFFFMDHTKDLYGPGLDWALENVRTGGMITAHNALRHGHIVAPENENDHLMRAFNARFAHEERLLSTLIGIGDGLLAGIVIA